MEENEKYVKVANSEDSSGPSFWSPSITIKQPLLRLVDLDGATSPPHLNKHTYFNSSSSSHQGILQKPNVFKHVFGSIKLHLHGHILGESLSVYYNTPQLSMRGSMSLRNQICRLRFSQNSKWWLRYIMSSLNVWNTYRVILLL